MRYPSPEYYEAKAIQEVGRFLNESALGLPVSKPLTVSETQVLRRYAGKLAKLTSDPGPTDTRPQCSDCSNCLMIDYGYSNYTVEGTTVYCELGLHPKAPFDNWYGQDWRLDFAAFCPSFTEGKPVEIDVDQEDASPEDLARWADYQERHRP